MRNKRVCPHFLLLMLPGLFCVEISVGVVTTSMFKVTSFQGFQSIFSFYKVSCRSKGFMITLHDEENTFKFDIS